MEEALKILSEVKESFELPIITDIHTEAEATLAADVADVLQIPVVSLPADRSSLCGWTNRERP